ncbi:ROK family transcriptional regulator [Asanoa sp. WMMD1127]|uniref:ROK family transcriptional regulator n=1 Tax=Asanoa sp. WMMD1127 TaxID=3016107 RepID=UPI002415C3B8|nr:ROK family transcriptional regulator [Asanoa sp. WMMD1127]MDG4820410.1 ROK family transcriptional regulator [Asanoa sp. WMMD1127]
MNGQSAVRQASVRAHNLALVLRQVAAASRPPSRADLATRTGLTRATVSALVDDLVGGGLLAEVGPAPRAGAGRPATGLVLHGYGPAGLGLEINVDYLAACVVDLTGTVRHRAVVHGDQRPHSPEAVLAAVADLGARLRAEAAAAGRTVAGAALAVPGLVSPTGLVHRAPNLAWHDVDAAGTLAGGPLGDLPLTVDNEANLAALAELHAGGPELDSFVYVSGEIGIGAGIVLHRDLFRGARGWSGELGHVCVEPAGPRCRCGALGCLEQYAGQEALLRDLPAGEAGLARLRDDTALAGLRLPAAGTSLGVALAGVVNMLDVGAVVLGGIFGPLAPWLAPAVEAELSRRVLTSAWSPVTVRASALGTAAAAVGAGGAVIRAVLADPAGALRR